MQDNDENLLLPPALVTIPGATPALIGGVFAAAAGLYRCAPWGTLSEQTPLEIRCPVDRPARLAVVLGAGGQAYGLCAYDNQADLLTALASTDPLQAAATVNWLALSFESRHFLAQQDLEAIDQYSWQVADPQAYPAITRLGAPGPDLNPPSLEDLIWLEGALPTINQFCQGSLDRAIQGALTYVVNTTQGPVEVSLRMIESSTKP